MGRKSHEFFDLERNTPHGINIPRSPKTVNFTWEPYHKVLESNRIARVVGVTAMRRQIDRNARGFAYREYSVEIGRVERHHECLMIDGEGLSTRLGIWGGAGIVTREYRSGWGELQNLSPDGDE